jgi:RNA polymerase subunit RPABC4/transcription elongation factor Spt4
MKPCRDCSTPVSSAERSCPHCGILNPVITWVAHPDGSHLTQRVPASERRPALAAKGSAPSALAIPRPTAAPVPPAAMAAAYLKPAPQRTGFARYFGPVESVEEARSVIVDASNGFYFLAALNLLFGLILFPAALVDAVILTVLSLWLRTSASRVPAGLLLVLAVLGIASTAMALAGKAEGGRNVYLALLTLGMAYRALRATMILAERGEPRLAM